MPTGHLQSFAERVYLLVTRIPHGRVTTYGAIARALGDPHKAREVGWALSATPDNLNLPAHRVINRNGALSGAWAFGGYHIHRALLEAEGVTFLDDGGVDLEQHLWVPEGE